MPPDGDPILVSAARAPGEARRGGAGVGSGSAADGAASAGAGALVLPAALRAGAGRTPEGAAWIGRLPDLVDRAARRWGLALGAPFRSGSASWCAPATDAAGRDLVLKVSFPHDEARDEAAVLRAWGGRGAVPLVDVHAGDWALLLGRARPGTPMRAVRTPATRRLAEAADVLRELHAAPAPAGLPALADVARGLADLAAERAGRGTAAGVRLDPGLLRAADATLRGAGAAGPSVSLHGDYNPGNLLLTGAGAGARWVAIDPKALSGDPAYDVWPLLEQVGDPWRTPDPVRTLRDRLLLVAERAGLDGAGAARWSVARGVEAALWVWHHGSGRPGAVRAVHGTLARARDWARVADLLAG
ncbi:aminoglycoside phosphotransferase family protein [Cellulomonas sp. IC4_254]|uniref:aminoglycoside phosphotransferase family protein n=1 Tax=Cellulomonas sp. IC4_254 TaxID=2714040 RepID=UPI00141F39F6|nr:phosphotransferase [Cellulomonas sp. IC4_254]